jgi:hypothetical protein
MTSAPWAGIIMVVSRAAMRAAGDLTAVLACAVVPHPAVAEPAFDASSRALDVPLSNMPVLSRAMTGPADNNRMMAGVRGFSTIAAAIDISVRPSARLLHSTKIDFTPGPREDRQISTTAYTELRPPTPIASGMSRSTRDPFRGQQYPLTATTRS